ncbi:DMT family transporter [uncultured Pseudodesulfovibrio sp.]|uniref:DMT family transporter n=1 Tax=uncultured Pseudodesulfovibrio sp. TaxID=2035858 RepID=UPI0029C92533|nr:DMT family transporter [uncultured Pseudodesulfovibrio sp.]
MTWFLFSICAAFLMASNSAYMKRFFSDVSPWEMSIIPYFYSMPMCAVGLFFIDIPDIGPAFFPALMWVLPLLMIAIVLHYRAIHMSPLSLTLPFLSFTPVFVLFTGDLILDEKISTPGIIGMMLVVAGGYVLNLDSAKSNLFGPIKAIFREPGSAIMLVVAALYGLCSAGGKVLILNSSPMFAAMVIFGLYGLLLTTILVAVGKASLRTILRKPLLGIGTGLIVYAEILFHNLAISMVAAAYMITIKRMSGIFSVFYGWILFKEHGIRYRFAGTVIMTIGAAVIALYG